MTRGAAFYFANLGADIARAYRTLERLRAAKRPEAYEEALLMLRGLALARETPEQLASFQDALDSLIAAFSARLAL